MAGVQFLSECGTLESVLPLDYLGTMDSGVTVDEPTVGYLTSDVDDDPRRNRGTSVPKQEVAATLVSQQMTDPAPLWRLLEDEFWKQRVLRTLARMNRENL